MAASAETSKAQELQQKAVGPLALAGLPGVLLLLLLLRLEPSEAMLSGQWGAALSLTSSCEWGVRLASRGLESSVVSKVRGDATLWAAMGDGVPSGLCVYVCGEGGRAASG
jgi:hypothetical protein